MRFATLCSGIGAPEVAFRGFGWEQVFCAEVEPFPCSVLAHHWPEVPNLGDITADDFVERAKALGKVDLIVAGTPCQSFSVAGLRKGLSDNRGNLTLRFVEICDALGPEWILWENVPGVLSGLGNAFGAFLGAMSGEDAALVAPTKGAKWTAAGLVRGPERDICWRVLDAQHFGVPQRRRRVFALASAGAGCPAEILFEPKGVCGDTAAGGEAGERVAALSCRRTAGGGFGTDFDCDGGLIVSAEGGSPEFTASSLSKQFNNQMPLTFNWQNGGGYGEANDGLGIGEDESPPPSRSQTPAVAFTCKDHGADAGQTAPTLRGMQHSESHANAGGQVAILAPSVTASNNPSRSPQSSEPVTAQVAGQVRRLTPRECERLQGFPDDHTLVEHRGRPAADGPRYRAIGNAMCVNVVRWIGERMP